MFLFCLNNSYNDKPKDEHATSASEFIIQNITTQLFFVLHSETLLIYVRIHSFLGSRI